MQNEELTTEEIAQHYSAMMDSVNLINAGKPEDMKGAEWADVVSKNREHLTLMLDKDFWTNEDLTVVQAVIV